MAAPENRSEVSLIHSYNTMLFRIQERINTAQKPVAPTFKQALNSASHQALHLKELNASEVNYIGKLITNDLNDAAEYIIENSPAYSEWLTLDINMIEKEVLNYYLQVCETIKTELKQLSISSRYFAIEHINVLNTSIRCCDCKPKSQLDLDKSTHCCSECTGSDFPQHER